MPALLALAVLPAHLWLAGRVMDPQWGEGAADRLRPRIEVAFVRELQQSAPPPAAVPVTPVAAPASPRRAAAPPPAASSPLAEAPADAGPVMVEPPPVPETAPPPEPVPPLPVLADASTPPVPATAEAPASAAVASPGASTPATAVAAASASAPAGAQAVEWPPSTRLTYLLGGSYRGPIEGQARVEWLRAGNRYQVYMEASVGPSFAPLITRRDSSEGEITEQGLRPRRYDLDSKALIGDARRSTIHLDEERIRLPGGPEVPRPPGVQDAVSQFVHLTWLFTTDPRRLEPGTVIEVPLALPRRVEPLLYDVVGRERLNTPAGAIETVHVKPRREPRPGGDYSAEMWVAPTLQYLPVRILIRQDAQTWIDLQIDRLPQQAASDTRRVAVPASAR